MGTRIPVLAVGFPAVEIRSLALALGLPGVEMPFQALATGLPALAMTFPAAELGLPVMEIAFPLVGLRLSAVEMALLGLETGFLSVEMPFPVAPVRGKAKSGRVGNRGLTAGLEQEPRGSRKRHYHYIFATNAFFVCRQPSLFLILYENSVMPWRSPELLSDAQVARIQRRLQEELGLTSAQFLARFKEALREDTGVVQSHAAAKMRLDRVFYRRMRRRTSDTTKLALARALDWTLLELEKAIAEKNNGSRKRRKQ